ncbi:MAG: hypothetical protein ACR2QZ_03860 [Woeseiaceae bacterium]
MDTRAHGRLAAVFREHPALLVSSIYVAASAIGIFYSWAYLRQFGINVLNYAQISDFLIASLREPFTWLIVALAVGLVVLDNANSRRIERKGPGWWLRWYGSSRYRFFNDFTAIAIVLVLLYAYAAQQANETRRGAGKLVTVSLAEGGEVSKSILLGTT